ncbi:accessory factor associated with RNA polymerase II [Binucleata daphniae]
MEILKRVMCDKTYEITEHEKTKIVDLDTCLSNDYTLEQLIFYVKHCKDSHNEYFEKCANSHILPVSLIDTKYILDAINNYHISNYSFTNNTTNLQKDFSYILSYKEEKNKKNVNIVYNIVVPNSINSLITTQNVVEFCINKNLIDATFEDNLLSPDYMMCKLQGFDVRIVNNADNFSQKDWQNTLCIFVDGESWQFKKWKVTDLVSVFTNIPTYSVHKKNKLSKFITEYKVTTIAVDEENKIRTNVDIMREINKRKQQIEMS